MKYNTNHYEFLSLNLNERYKLFQGELGSGAHCQKTGDMRIYILKFFQWSVDRMKRRNSLCILIYRDLNKKDIIGIHILT